MRTNLILRSVIVSSAVLVAASGCRTEEPPPSGSSGGFSGGNTQVSGAGGRIGSGGATSSGGSAVTTGGSGGTGASGGTVSSSGGSGGSVIGSGGSAGNGTGGSGGTSGSAGSGATAGGGTGASGGLAGNGGMGGKACVDVQPPADPNWPGATCTNWANETKECTADWFAQYCDVSCGRCTPQGTGGSAGAGSGGSGGSGGGTAGSAGSSSKVDCSTQGLPNVTGGNGYATRYWDCCQTHCSQFDGHRCGQDGVSKTSDSSSSCTGGGSYACYDEAPHAVSDCLSYGYIAKANPNCGGCYRIQFTGEGQYSATDPGSQLIKGKQMIVKVSNTGGDVASNQFDMMIPGGGVGQFNACSKEWGTSDLGAQYGGFLTNCTGDHNAKKECVRQACMKIPAGSARDGCIWFVDWFEVADNPKFTSQSTDCPF